MPRQSKRKRKDGENSRVYYDEAWLPDGIKRLTREELRAQIEEVKRRNDERTAERAERERQRLALAQGPQQDLVSIALDYNEGPDNWDDGGPCDDDGLHVEPVDGGTGRGRLSNKTQDAKSKHERKQQRWVDLTKVWNDIRLQWRTPYDRCSKCGVESAAGIGISKNQEFKGPMCGPCVALTNCEASCQPVMCGPNFGKPMALEWKLDFRAGDVWHNDDSCECSYEENVTILYPIGPRNVTVIYCLCNRMLVNEKTMQRNLQYLVRGFFPTTPYAAKIFVSMELLDDLNTFVTAGNMTRARFIFCADQRAYSNFSEYHSKIIQDAFKVYVSADHELQKKLKGKFYLPHCAACPNEIHAQWIRDKILDKPRVITKPLITDHVKSVLDWHRHLFDSFEELVESAERLVAIAGDFYRLTVKGELTLENLMKNQYVISVDAAFKLQQARTRQSIPVARTHAYDYYVDPGQISARIRSMKKNGIESCGSNFKAQNQTLGSLLKQKIPITGLFGACCSPHGNPVAKTFSDISEGEEQKYSDRALASVQEHLNDHDMSHVRLIWMYDIACVYQVNIKQRITGLPGLDDVTFKIPLFHLRAHRESCIQLFNVRNTPGCGLVCGETMESLWSTLNRHNASWRQMGTGERANTISHTLYQYGTQKQTELLPSILKKYAQLPAVIANHNRQLQYLRTALNFPSEQQIAAWRQTIAAAGNRHIEAPNEDDTLRFETYVVASITRQEADGNRVAAQNVQHGHAVDPQSIAFKQYLEKCITHYCQQAQVAENRRSFWIGRQKKVAYAEQMHIRVYIAKHKKARDGAIKKANDRIDLWNSQCDGVADRFVKVDSDGDGLMDQLRLNLAERDMPLRSLELIRSIDFMERCKEEQEILEEQMRSVLANRAAELEHYASKVNECLADEAPGQLGNLPPVPDLLAGSLRKAFDELLWTIVAAHKAIFLDLVTRDDKKIVEGIVSRRLGNIPPSNFNTSTENALLREFEDARGGYINNGNDNNGEDDDDYMGRLGELMDEEYKSSDNELVDEAPMEDNLEDDTLSTASDPWSHVGEELIQDVLNEEENLLDDD